jgi:hypothetical protein
MFNTIFKNGNRVVTGYKTDFDHDKTWINDNPTNSFIHISRENGTHLIPFLHPHTIEDEAQRYIFGWISKKELLLKPREAFQAALKAFKHEKMLLKKK